MHADDQQFSPQTADGVAPQSPATGWRKHTPNALTAGRVALTAAVVACLHEPSTERLGIAAAGFVIAAITDAMDGALARRWNAVSLLGRVLDPAADKLLVLGSLVMLAGPGFYHDGVQSSGVHPWMVAAVLSRELLVTSIRTAMEAQGVAFGASWAGKLKMILQSAAVPLILGLLWLAPDAAADGWARAVIDVSVWAMLLATVLSAVPYITKAVSTEKSP